MADLGIIFFRRKHTIHWYKSLTILTGSMPFRYLWATLYMRRYVLTNCVSVYVYVCMLGRGGGGGSVHLQMRRTPKAGIKAQRDCSQEQLSLAIEHPIFESRNAEFVSYFVKFYTAGFFECLSYTFEWNKIRFFFSRDIPHDKIHLQ